jgi:hypothetical protein
MRKIPYGENFNGTLYETKEDSRDLNLDKPIPFKYKIDKEKFEEILAIERVHMIKNTLHIYTSYPIDPKQGYGILLHGKTSTRKVADVYPDRKISNSYAISTVTNESEYIGLLIILE